MGGRAVFMRAAGGDNHHDLGLFSVGPAAPNAPRGSVGLYHLAWEVPTIDDLAAAAGVLSEAAALTGASDHGVSKSLYGPDPDGNEFEIMWRVPREAWGEYEHQGADPAARPRARARALGPARSRPRLRGTADPQPRPRAQASGRRIARRVVRTIRTKLGK